MKIKKYIAPTMPEALTKIKRELGPDAIILHNKQIKVGGIFGLFKTTKLEVTAALDENPLPSKEKKIDNPSVALERQTSPRQHQESDGQQRVLQEIEQLRQLVTTQARYESNHFAAPFNMVFANFLEQDVQPFIAEDIVTRMEKQYQTEVEQESDVSFYVMDFIQTSLQPMIKDTTKSHKKVIQFVGPTGVGKTTTVAKIAAKAMLEQNKSVAFITTDTYRIAATEQLNTYAKILGVPLEVAYTKTDYTAAIEKFSTYDHIFVDTAGRNYRDNTYVEELEKMITFHDEHHETYAVLSLTAKGKDNIDVFQVFQEKGIEQVIFTKLDETTTYESIINLCLGNYAKVAYISNGQNVPEDVIAADAASIAKLMISGHIYE